MEMKHATYISIYYMYEIMYNMMHGNGSSANLK